MNQGEAGITCHTQDQAAGIGNTAYLAMRPVWPPAVWPYGPQPQW